MIMKLSVHVVARVAVLAALGFAGCPSALPIYTVGVIHDQVYALGYVSETALAPNYELTELRLDTYYPEENEETDKVAVILIHGGSFEEGGKDKVEVVDHARFFASRGMVAFSIDYRLTDDNPPAPSYYDIGQLPRAAHASFVDAKAAVRFVRANSDLYGIDPNKIVVWGESAGAIAAIAVAMTDPGDYESDGDDFPIPQVNYPAESPEVQGCIELWGGTLGLLLLEFDVDDPPMMIVHGEEDDEPFVSFQQAELIHWTLEALSLPHEFYPIENAGHGAWDARVDGKSLKLLAQDFINEYVAAE
jgi:predicted esterase